jgi:fatty-acyl-CoA synthase
MRIVDLLERDASLHANRPAVEIVGGATLTYRELRERVTKVAGGLAERGVGRGDRIAVMVGNGLLFFDVYLVAAYLGAAAVPINSHLTALEAAFQLRDSEPALAFADAAHAEVISAAMPPEVELVLDAQAARPRDLSSLRLLVYGAAPTAVPTIRRAMAELDCGLYQGYGLRTSPRSCLRTTPLRQTGADSSSHVDAPSWVYRSASTAPSRARSWFGRIRS